MRKIEFVAGYYEWNLFIDDKFVYVFGDGDTENFNRLEELESFADICINCMDMQAEKDEDTCFGFVGEEREENKELWLSLTSEEKEKVKQAIIEKWSWYVNDWRKRTSVAFTIKLNKNTQEDVIERLNSVENRTQYIVELIRKDLKEVK